MLLPLLLNNLLGPDQDGAGGGGGVSSRKIQSAIDADEQDIIDIMMIVVGLIETLK